MCSVDTLLADHDLTLPDQSYDSVDAYLVERRIGADGRAPQEYAALRDWLNVRVLAAVYAEHGRPTMRSQLVREYEAITAEWSLERDELSRDLAADGLDIDALEAKFVSADTVRAHVEDCLDVDATPATTDGGWRRAEIETAKRLAESKVRSVLPGLSATGALPDASTAAVNVDVEVECSVCGTRVSVDDALDRGAVCPTHADRAGEDERSSEGDVSPMFATTPAFLAALPFLDDLAALAVDVAAGGLV